MTTSPAGSQDLDEAAVRAIAAHMNADHAGDCLLICRALGGVADATTAVVSAVDLRGIEFVARAGDHDVPVRLEWIEPVANRRDVRSAVVALFERAQLVQRGE